MPRHSPFRRHTLLLKFFNGVGGFFDSADAHPFEHVRCFSELDVIVGNHLDSVAPRVAKIEPPIQCLNSQLYQRSAYRLPVIYDKTEMALVVCFLGPAEAQLDELIAEIDKSIVVALAAMFKIKDRAVKFQRGFKITHFQNHMVDTQRARLFFAFVVHGARRPLSNLPLRDCRRTRAADSVSTYRPAYL